MPKTLKLTPEIDTFDFGKAVTLILSQVKELHKTRNTLVDEITYLEARKKQASEALERLAAEKAELLKVKAEVTAKIMAQKEEFSQQIATMQQELTAQRTALEHKAADITALRQKVETSQAERQNELELRTSDFKKEMQASMETLDKREANLIAREEQLNQSLDQQVELKSELERRQAELTALEVQLHADDVARANKKAELSHRENSLAANEKQLAEQRQTLAALAADLENQAALLEQEKRRNTSDAEMLRTMNKQLKDKQLELSTREIHLHDREATALSH